MPRDTSIQFYYRKRNRCKKTFPCSGCHEVICSKVYEMHHAKTCLGVDIALQCVWCRGQFSWPKFNKKLNVDHLLACFKKFITRMERETALPHPGSSTAFPHLGPPTAAARLVENFTLIDHSPVLPRKQLYGRSKIPDVPDCFFEDVFLWEMLNDHPYRLFQDENLNTALASVVFFDTGKYYFYHVMVRAIAFDIFMYAMESGDPEARTLPFSCLCDGGDERMKPIHRHHRHMIVVCPSEPRNRFQSRVWSKVKIAKVDQPFKYYRCTYKKPILTKLHLVNTIFYLSNRESICHGCFERSDNYNNEQQPQEGDEEEEIADSVVESVENEEKNNGKATRNNGNKMNHYWIMTPLPKNYRLALVLAWEGGIMELIKQNYKNIDPVNLLSAPSLRSVNGVWKVAVKDLPGIEKGLVLPVSKNLRPTTASNNEKEQNVLHLNNGRVIRFERDESLMDLDSQAWGRIQADGGNAFYEVVGEELWTPGPFIQKCLDCVAHLKEENDRLREENVLLRTEKNIDEKKNYLDHLMESSEIEVMQCESL